MTTTTTKAEARRTDQIIECLAEAFAPLMKADPVAFRGKYRKMAGDPFAFYRGSACLFYSDMTARAAWDADWIDDASGRIWIHGDLHVENFGSYLDSDGRLVFDINDFDEAYIGHYTWDLQRFAASLALMAWRKALPEDSVRSLIARYTRGYLMQVNRYLETEDDDGDFSLDLSTSGGEILRCLLEARGRSRLDLLDSVTGTNDGRRSFRAEGSMSRLSRAERRKVEKAFEAYVETIPEDKKSDRAHFYSILDVVRKTGFGIGSAGLPAYNVLIEGHSQAADNDVLLSMKQANVPAVTRFVDTSQVDAYFDNDAHRTVVSQRALQVHTDALLGWTEIDGVGFVVSEVSPYEVGLDWERLDEPSDIAPVVEQLGRATAKVHCASDEDSDQSLVNLSVEEAVAGVLEGRRKAFVEALTDFGMEYAVRARKDHALFVQAFRSGRIGVDAV